MQRGVHGRQFSVVARGHSSGGLGRRRSQSPQQASGLQPLLVSIAVVTTAALAFTFPDWSHWAGLDDAASAANSGSALVGIARVIDADTIELQGTRIRLAGIDAPEMRQNCQLADGTAYLCGQRATSALEDHVSRGTVECRGDELDRYGRTLAVCYLGAEDLNGWLVSEGWAVAYTHYSLAYVPQEAVARMAGRGIWAGSFDMPWDWRKTH